MTPSPSVFIVEDEALIAMELRDRLTRLGYEVRGVAAHGERAVEEIPTAAPDLVLMDINLAGQLDGIETARRVRERTDVPVVFLTAFSDPELVRRASALGPHGYLLKPFEERELHATIQVALVKHRADRALREANERLEEQVRARTAELARLNADLEGEVARRAAALTASEGRYQALVDHISDALIRDDESGRLVYANARFLDWFGLHDRDLRGVRLEDYVSPEWRAALRERHDRRMRGEPVPDRFEYEGARADGRRFWVEVSVTPVTENGQIVGTQSILRDVTERKEMERRLGRAQRLEAVGTLAGGIAHDLNNALTPVTMALGHLRALCPEHAELLDILDAGCMRAVGMVRQLLTFAKGSADGKRVAVPVRPLILEIEKIARSTFPKSIRFTADAPPGLPSVEADPTQLHQILLNLCVNARDAMPGGGTLTVTARATDLDAADVLGEPDATPGHYLVLSVADTGAGIPPEVLDRIFEPFFTTKGPEQGTGLGLFTVLGMTKKHGGFVRVRSRVGTGTEFAVYLPACPTAAPAPRGEPTEPTAPARGAGELILVVDDDDGVRAALRAILTGLGFRVLTAENGAAGLAAAAAHHAELRAVITDLHMPVMSGIALAGELRRLAPALPVVVVSGLLSESDADQLRELGVRSILGKPFTQEGLLGGVRAALGSHA